MSQEHEDLCVWVPACLPCHPLSLGLDPAPFARGHVEKPRSTGNRQRANDDHDKPHLEFTLIRVPRIRVVDLSSHSKAKGKKRAAKAQKNGAGDKVEDARAEVQPDDKGVRGAAQDEKVREPAKEKGKEARDRPLGARTKNPRGRQRVRKEELRLSRKMPLTPASPSISHHFCWDWLRLLFWMSLTSPSL
jgi:hypothetical protein